VAAPYAPFGDVHLAWSAAGLYLLHLAQNHLEPPFLDYVGEFPLSETYRVGLTLDAGAGERRFCIALSPTNSTRWPNVWEISPRAFALDGDRPAPAPGLVVQQLAKPLPHIALEAFIPAAAQGVRSCGRAGPSPGPGRARFFRVKRMTFPGRPGLPSYPTDPSRPPRPTGD
jgi:hypothetical protein